MLFSRRCEAHKGCCKQKRSYSGDSEGFFILFLASKTPQKFIWLWDFFYLCSREGDARVISPSDKKNLSIYSKVGVSPHRLRMLQFLSLNCLFLPVDPLHHGRLHMRDMLSLVSNLLSRGFHYHLSTYNLWHNPLCWHRQLQQSCQERLVWCSVQSRGPLQRAPKRKSRQIGCH